MHKNGKRNDESTTAVGLIQRLMEYQHAMTAAEVAKILACSHQTVYRMAQQSQLPYFRVSGSIRFDPSAIVEWLKRQGVR